MSTFIAFNCKDGNKQMQLIRKTDSIEIEIRDSENEFTNFDIDIDDVETFINELKLMKDELQDSNS